MRKNNIIFGVLIGLVVCLTASLSMTYARYVTNLGDIEEQTVTVAKWSFLADNTGEDLYEFELDKTYDENTLVNGKIAPGTSGKLTFNLSNEHSEVAADYVINLEFPTYPTNIRVYTDDNNTGTTMGAEITKDNDLTYLYGTMLAGEKNHIRTIYWVWSYESDSESDSEKEAYDLQDTTDGITATTPDTDISMKFVAKITGTQSQVFGTDGTAATSLKATHNATD